MDERKLGRSRALREFPLQPCETCGATAAGNRRGFIHRHHRDGDQTNNDPANIAFLCKPHHDAEHDGMASAGIGRERGGARPRIVAMLRDRAHDDAARAAALRDSGFSTPAIAEAMGVNRGTVTRWFRKYEV